MATNSYFKTYNTSSEQQIVEDLTAEAIQIAGIDVLYIPRKIQKLDILFGEDVLSKFDDTYQIEMYIEDIDSFGGSGDLYTKFGIDITDEMTIIVSRQRFHAVVGAGVDTYSSRSITTSAMRPKEGDLIYFPFNNGLFEISFVQDEDPFYPNGTLTTYKMTCRLYEYDQAEMDTGLITLDEIDGRTDILGEVPEDTFIAPATTPIVWTSTTAVTVGQFIYPPVGAETGRYYRVEVAGTTSTIEPTWSSILNDLVYDDGGPVYLTQGAWDENEVIEQEVEDVIDWSEDNPFGSY